jgi:hypothetical protein
MAIIRDRPVRHDSIPVWVVKRAAKLTAAVGRIAVRGGRGFGTGS